MKKRFFKRLSLVLALAMVLSVVSPAAGAFAKPAPSLNSVKRYLHLGREETNKNWFNFNIKNKKSGWKYVWESADESVATVKETNGVTTAVGVGRTEVTVYITDKDGNDVTELTAEVIVRDNIEEVTIKNPIETLAVGEEYNFNRDFVTEAGRTDKTSAITRWTIKPAEGVELNAKNGVVVPQEAGEYTITAWSFQSKARYNNWLKDPVKYADQVLDTDTCTFTVGSEMKEVKQKNLSKVDVTFSSPMTKDEVKANVYIHYMIGDVAINEQKIKDVEMSSNGLIATVEIYDTFVPERTYRVTYPEMDDKDFVAATVDPDDVKGIKITTDKATIFKSTPIRYELLNANGVVINQPVDVNNLGTRVTFKSSNDLISIFNDEIMFFNKGDVTAVTATYHTYDYVDGVERVYEDVGTIVGVEEGDIYGEKVLSWTIVNNDNPNFGDAKQFIAVDDFDYRLFVEISLTNDNKVNNKYDSLIKLTSSNSNILFVDTMGYLVPVREGEVSITVEYDGRFVGAFSVTVSPKRRVARLVVDKPFHSLSNAEKTIDEYPNDGWTDEVNVKAKLIDQYGADYGGSGLNIKALSQKAIEKFGSGEQSWSSGSTFDPGGLEEGRYQFLIFDSAYPALTGQVTFEVKSPVGNAVSWKVELSGTYDNGNVDVVVKDTDQSNKKLGVELMGYAKNGVKTGPENLEAENMIVNIKNAKGEILDGKTKNSNSSYNVTWVSDDPLWTVASGSAISGQAIDKLETGRYTVEIIEDGTVRGRTIFTVVDSQTQPTVEVLGFRTDNKGLAAFTDTFKVELNGAPVAAENLAPDWNRTSTATRAYAKKVKVKEYVKDNKGKVNYDYYIVHEKDIKYYITVPVEFDSYSN